MEEEALIIGNGAAELIFALGYSLRPKRALLPQPTFAEYEQALLAAGCEVFYYPLSEENGFRLTEDFLPLPTGERDMVFLCNPNNPTGVLAEDSQVIYYDLQAKPYFPTDAPSDKLTTFQLKIADVTVQPYSYKVYWVRTFKTLEDLKVYVEKENNK